MSSSTRITAKQQDIMNPCSCFKLVLRFAQVLYRENYSENQLDRVAMGNILSVLYV